MRPARKQGDWDMVKKPSQPGLVYKDFGFMDGEEARPLRILSEYLQPLSKFREFGIHDTIVFFGSARQTAEASMEISRIGTTPPRIRRPPSTRTRAEWPCANPASLRRLRKGP